MPTPTAASGTSASSLPLLGLKQTPAAIVVPQVIPKDAPPARAIVLLLWGCLRVLRSVRQVGLPRLMLGKGLMLGEDLRLEEGPDAGAGTSDAGGGPDAGLWAWSWGRT